MNFLDAEVTISTSDRVSLAVNSQLEVEFDLQPGSPVLARGTRVMYGIRPENLHAPHRREGSTGYLSLSGKLDAIERMGDQNFVYYHVSDLGGQRVVIARVHDYRDLNENASVNFVFRPNAGHVFLADGTALKKKR